MFSVAGGVVQFFFPFRRIEGHLPVDVPRRGMVGYPVQGKHVQSFIECGRNGAQQPVFQDANAANTAFIEIEPVRDDEGGGIAVERHFLQERQQHSLLATGDPLHILFLKEKTFPLLEKILTVNPTIASLSTFVNKSPLWKQKKGLT